jgi:hypothetical protein
MPVHRSGSPTIRPIAVPRVQRRERILEDHLHPPRKRPQLASPSVVMSRPSKTIRPAVGL